MPNLIRLNIVTPIRESDVAESDEVEILVLKRKVNDHIDDYREFVRSTVGKDIEQDRRLLASDVRHEQNLEAIEKLTAATAGIVEAWSTAAGVRRFVKWLSGFAILGVVLSWLIDKFPS
jgi:hypothetical protein